MPLAWALLQVKALSLESGSALLQALELLADSLALQVAAVAVDWCFAGDWLEPEPYPFLRLCALPPKKYQRLEASARIRSKWS